MTKVEYLKDIVPYEKWLEGHMKYLHNALGAMRPYFDADKFVEDYKNIANENVIKSILADSFENNNCDLGEMENTISRLLCIPYRDVVKYRTDKFWAEIA